MFKFLNPIFLWILFAVAIPILIHLFSRQRVKKIDFSSLIFLKTLERTRLRAVRIKEILLLLIRSLIILFVVLAFARPSSKIGFASKMGVEARSSILFLIDNSYRMGYETREGNLLWLAKKRCEELLKIYKERDELYLINYNLKPEKFLSHPVYDSSLISRGIREIELSFKPADLDKSLESGVELLARSNNENKELYLLSDLKTKERFLLNNWDSSLGNEGIKLIIIELSEEEKENCAITEIEPPSGIVSNITPFEISGIVKNYGRKPVQNLLISFFLDGKRVGQKDLNLNEGEWEEISFVQPIDDAGIHSGYLELYDDNLMVDNKRFFTFKVPEKIKVLLVGSEGKEENYLKLAMNPENDETNRFEISRVDPSSFPGKDLSNYQVIIFSDLSELSPENLPGLDDFLSEGKGIFFFLENGEEDVSIQICKRYINSEYKGREDIYSKGSGFLTLEKLDLLHPIFQPYRELEKSKFPQIRFFSIHEIETGGYTKVLASFSNGKPALVESFFRSGKVLVFLSSLDPEFSDLGEHTLLVPLLQRSTEYLSSNLITTKGYLIGEKVRKEYELKGTIKVELLDPENLKVILIPEYIEDKLVLKLDDLNKHGIYEIQSQNRLLDQFAVNLDIRDSDFGFIKNVELEKEFRGNGNIITIKPQQNVIDEIMKIRYGRELSKNFLWIALCLLILEMLLSKNRKKDMESSPRLKP